MAEYDAKIRVSAETRQADDSLKKLQNKLDSLSRTASGLNFGSVQSGIQGATRGIQQFGREASGVLSRGLFAGAVLGAGQLASSISIATSNLGPFSGAVKAAGAAFSSSLGGVPGLLGDILTQIGQIPNGLGLATVAAMAFAPQLLKASSAAVGLGDAIDKAVGQKAATGIAELLPGLNRVEETIKRTAAPMELIREELSLAKKELDRYVAFTQESVTAAENLLAVERMLTAEKRAQSVLMTSLDPYASRRMRIQQNIARIRRGEAGGSAAFRESMARQNAIRDAANRDVYLQQEIRRRQPTGPLMLPAFQERGLMNLMEQNKIQRDNVVLEQNLNTERIRGVRYLEKQTQEEQRQIQLGLLGQRTNALPGQRGTGFAFPMAGPAPLDLYGAGRRQQPRPSRVGGGRLGGAVSGAIIGGAFPLLFGQGQGAAAGGAIGGLVGGLAGPGGSFAGSLLGTLLGDIAERGKQIKELGADIGFSAEQTKKLQEAFKLAGQDADKFTAAVQNIRGLSLELEDQASIIQALTQLTSSYGGSIDKTSMAFTSALSSGKVTQATLNQLTSQNIPIQEKLAATYNVSRSELLQMAKDGKISVQDLADAFIDLANESAKGPTKAQSAYAQAFTQIQLAAGNLTTKIKDSLNIQVSEGVKAAETLALRVSKAFTDILKSIEPVVLLLSATTGAFINLGIQAGQALAGIPGMVSDIATQLIGMLPGFGAVYKILAGIASLRGGNQRGGVASPLNLNQGMEANWPEGVPRPGTVPAIGRITAPSQMAASGGGKKDRGAAAAEREAERVAKALRDTQAETELLRIQAGLQDRIFQAEQAKDPLLAARLKGEEEILNIQFKYATALANESNSRVQEALVAKGLQEIENARLKTAQTLEQIEAERAEKYNTLIEDLNLELELKNVVKESDKERLRIEFEIGRLRKEGIYTEEQLLVIQQKRLALAAQDTAGQRRMKELQQSLADLTNLENVAVSSADIMGNAFGEAFQEIINGSSSAQEALAKMMNSIGENFVNMAAQIIAQQVTMIILGTILKALGIGFSAGGGGGGGGGAGVNVTPQGTINPLPGFNAGGGVMAANGAVFANGTAKFAKGGLVTRPTMFRFADGGAMQNGLMGEAGPEAVMPLRRSSDGRLGVDASGLREAMGSAPGSAGGGMALNMSFETTNIGGVEYVSRDQLEAAMAETRRQATRDGANRGMTMTLDRIKQSPQTRSRIGIR